MTFWGTTPVLTAVTTFTDPIETKKPTWSNALRRSTTSACSSTNPPARPGCPSPNHPTFIRMLLGADLKFHAAPPDKDTTRNEYGKG